MIASIKERVKIEDIVPVHKDRAGCPLCGSANKTRNMNNEVMQELGDMDRQGLIEDTPRHAPETTTGLKAVGIADFLSMKFPPRENILSPWLPTQ